MQCTIHQRRHLECNSLRHAEPMKTDERVGDVVTSQVEMSLAAAFWTDWRETGKSIRRLSLLQ